MLRQSTIVKMLIIMSMLVMIIFYIGISKVEDVRMQHSIIEFSKIVSPQTQHITREVYFDQPFATRKYFLVAVDGSDVMTHTGGTTRIDDTSFQVTVKQKSSLLSAFITPTKEDNWSRTWTRGRLQRMNVGGKVNVIVFATIATKDTTNITKVEFWTLADNLSFPKKSLATTEITTASLGSSFHVPQACLEFTNTTDTATAGYRGIVNFDARFFPGNNCYYIVATKVNVAPTKTKIPLNLLFPMWTGSLDRRCGWEWVKSGLYLILKFCYSLTNIHRTVVMSYNMNTDAKSYVEFVNGIDDPMSSVVSSVALDASDRIIIARRFGRALSTAMNISVGSNGSAVLGPTDGRYHGLLTINMLTTGVTGLLSLGAVIPIFARAQKEPNPESKSPYAVAQTFGRRRDDGTLPLYVAWSSINLLDVLSDLTIVPGSLVIVRYLLAPNAVRFVRDRTMFKEVEQQRFDARQYSQIGLIEVGDPWDVGKWAIQVQFTLLQSTFTSNYDGTKTFVSHPSTLEEVPLIGNTRAQGLYNEVGIISTEKNTRFLTLTDTDMRIEERRAPNYAAVGIGTSNT